MTDLESVLDGCAGKKIAVVGDFMLERYLRGLPESLSREAPVMVLRHESEDVLPGGAGQTAALLAALGCEVWPLGAVGDDACGDELLELMGRLTSHTDGLLKIRGRATSTRLRILAGDFGVRKQQVLRIDRGRTAPLDKAYEARLLSEVAALKEVDAWVLVEGGYGLLSEEVIQGTLRCVEAGFSIVDAGDRAALFKGATHLLLNAAEAARAQGIPAIGDAETALAVATDLRTRLSLRGLLVTRGNAGMVVADRDECVQLEAIGGAEVVDPSGAGDAVTLGATLGLVAGLPWRSAAMLANLCASLAVMRQGPAELRPRELREAIRRLEVQPS